MWKAIDSELPAIVPKNSATDPIGVKNSRNRIDETSTRKRTSSVWLADMVDSLDIAEHFVGLVHPIHDEGEIERLDF